MVPSSAKLNKIVKLSSYVSNNLDFHYDIFPLTKQTRVSFNLSSISTITCFQLIHLDSWGNYSTTSNSGAHYFFSIVDDFFRCTWVFLLKHKSEIEQLLKYIFFLMLKHSLIVKFNEYNQIMGLNFFLRQ